MNDNSRMIIITLLGGPSDGEEYAISNDIWLQGSFRVLAPSSSVKWVSEPEPITKIGSEILEYRRQRFHPGWACIAEDWDGVIKAVAACRPMHKWTFDRYTWA